VCHRLILHHPEVLKKSRSVVKIAADFTSAILMITSSGNPMPPMRRKSTIHKIRQICGAKIFLIPGICSY
jgi:hypothetical protein